MGEPNPQPEVWLRGPISGIPPALQPVAHCLLQALEEIKSLIADFPLDLLWRKPAGMASVGFHLQHITGVLDRLFTYAEGQPLSAEQLRYLSSEGKEDLALEVLSLFESLQKKIDQVLATLRQTEPSTLFETREVGRKKLPSSKFGLMFHAAEHTMRHTGQLHVTTKILLKGLD